MLTVRRAAKTVAGACCHSGCLMMMFITISARDQSSKFALVMSKVTGARFPSILRSLCTRTPVTLHKIDGACQQVSTELFLRPMEKVSDLHCIPKARTAAELFLAGGQSFHRRRSKTIGPLLKDSRGTSQCKSIPPRYSELFADQALQSCIEDSMRAFSSASTPSLSNYIGSE